MSDRAREQPCHGGRRSRCNLRCDPRGGHRSLAPVTAAAMTPLTTRMVELAAAEWRRKSSVVADSALRTSGVGDPEDFCRAPDGDPDMIALTQKILFAASVTPALSQPLQFQYARQKSDERQQEREI